MGIYQTASSPISSTWRCATAKLVPYRERVIASAQGRVLEVGISSGLNIPFYTPQMRELIGLEPTPRFIAMARDAQEWLFL